MQMHFPVRVVGNILQPPVTCSICIHVSILQPVWSSYHSFLVLVYSPHLNFPSVASKCSFKGSILVTKCLILKFCPHAALAKTGSNPGSASFCATGLADFTVDKSVEFTYEELADATDNFSMANKIGQGGFAVVFYGVIRGQVISATPFVSFPLHIFMNFRSLSPALSNLFVSCTPCVYQSRTVLTRRGIGSSIFLPFLLMWLTYALMRRDWPLKG